MKKYFITGLVIFLPAALTVAVAVFIFNLLTDPFIGVFKNFFERYRLFEDGFLFLNADELQIFISQLMVIVFLFGITVSLGMLARWFFFYYLIELGELLVRRIPFIGSIYNTCKDVIKTLFGSNANSFKQVVLIGFPNKQTKALGFLTQENAKGFESAGEERALVFVPTTPNPTSGFLMAVKKEEMTYLDMRVEDALKFIISCGVVTSSFNEKSFVEKSGAPAFETMEDPLPEKP